MATETETDIGWMTNPRWRESHLFLQGPVERHNANSYRRTACGRRANMGAVKSEKTVGVLHRCGRCLARSTA